jgi:tRNA modification GTPase
LQDLAGPSQAVLLTKRDRLNVDAIPGVTRELTAIADTARLISLESDTDGGGLEQVLDLLRGLVVPVNRPETQTIITRARHRHALARAMEALRAADALDLGSVPELAAEEYRRAADSLGRLTGQVDVEELLDSIFSSFCIGK